MKNTPQQNGVTERMNRTLLERVRCLLLNAGLSKDFWGEAMVTAAYLIILCPSPAFGFKTPMKLWQGYPPFYNNLSHIKHDKLEPRSLKYIFIGYPTRVQRYKL